MSKKIKLIKRSCGNLLDAQKIYKIVKELAKESNNQIRMELCDKLNYGVTSYGCIAQVKFKGILWGVTKDLQLFYCCKSDSWGYTQRLSSEQLDKRNTLKSILTSKVRKTKGFNRSLASKIKSAGYTLCKLRWVCLRRGCQLQLTDPKEDKKYGITFDNKVYYCCGGFTESSNAISIKLFGRVN